jgi:hypothetical protein
MTVRVAIDAAIDEGLLEDFTKEVQLVRIAEKAQGEMEIDFWVPALPPKIVPLLNVVTGELLLAL